LTFFERLLSLGLTRFARRLYDYDRRVVNFNNRNALRLLASLSSHRDLFRHILQNDPQRHQLLLTEVNELFARTRDLGRALPIELAVIHGSRVNFLLILPMQHEIVTGPTALRRLFTSLADYAMRFSPDLVDVVLQGANSSGISPSHMVNYSLRAGDFQMASALISYFQQQGQLNDQHVIEEIVDALQTYVGNQNLDRITSFFSFNELPHNLAGLREALIEQVFMRSVQLDADPGREDVSNVLVDNLSYYLTPDQRQRMMTLARSSGQLRVEERLRMGGFQLSPDVPPRELKRRRKD
jgi:hypothetical protein